ncbi:MAG: hypothetical protein ACRDKX_01635 [Solirubrobacterales bacterium]
MGRPKQEHRETPAQHVDDRVLRWRYDRFTRPLATDQPELGEAVVVRIARERKRLDKTGRRLAERVGDLERFVIDLGYAHQARRAMESPPPRGWTP